VLTGFWRSGTTWLLEALSKGLGAKPVFEPLVPEVTGYRAYVEKNYLGEDETRKGFMPFCAGSLAMEPVLRAHLVRSLTGAVPGVFVRAARFSVRRSEERRSMGPFGSVVARLRDSGRLRVVTKFTRAHLLLPLLQSEFSPTLIHIRRDPRAVVGSLSRQAWAGWVDSMSLEDYLLRTGDGRRDVFSQWTDQIRRCDRAGPVARIAGYWSLVEWYVDQFSSGDEVIVRFEQIVGEGSGYLNDRLSVVPGVSVLEEELTAESKTSKEKSRDQRMLGWKERLSSKEIEEIEDTVRMFGMDGFLLE